MLDASCLAGRKMYPALNGKDAFPAGYILLMNAKMHPELEVVDVSPAGCIHHPNGGIHPAQGGGDTSIS